MKILLAHNCYQHPGGEDAVLAMETAILREQGHQVLAYIENNVDIEKMNSFQVVGKAHWNRTAYHKMRQMIKKDTPDIVHVHNTWPLLSPAIYAAANAEGVPVVQTLHNYRLFCPSSTHFYRGGGVCEACLRKMIPYPGIWHACYRESRAQTLVLASVLSLHHWMKSWANRVDLFIALTEFARQKYIQGGLPDEKIIVKPNAVFPDPGKRNSTDGVYALFVGRVAREKGILTLLEAWRQMPNIPLKMVGDGPLLADAQAFVASYSLLQVEILGRRPHEDVVQLMKRARFLIFPSEWYEGFPMTIVEAFACGIPVLASRLGAMAEIIEDGHSGRLFEPGNAADLAAVAKWAWAHPQKLQEMGIIARHEYETKYNAEKNYQRLMEIYTLAETMVR